MSDLYVVGKKYRANNPTYRLVPFECVFVGRDVTVMRNTKDGKETTLLIDERKHNRWKPWPLISDETSAAFDVVMNGMEKLRDALIDDDLPETAEVIRGLSKRIDGLRDKAMNT